MSTAAGALALTPLNLDELPESARQWTLLDHVLQRANERGFNVLEVLMAAGAPDYTRPHKTKPHCVHHIRGDCEVVVDPGAREIITVIDSPLSTEESLRRRQAMAAAWSATPSPPEAEPVPAPKATSAPASARRPSIVTDDVLKSLTTQVIKGLRDRPGHWATLECNVPGLPTVLAKQPGVELTCSAGTIKIRLNV